MVLIALLVCWLVGEKGLMPSAMTIQRPCGRNIAGCASCMPRTVFSWENCARIGRMIGAVLYGGEREGKKSLVFLVDANYFCYLCCVVLI